MSTTEQTPKASEKAPYRYTPALAAQIETAWQDKWEQAGAFDAPNPSGPLAGEIPQGSRPFFLLDMFPYPSGKGLHVGHPLGYIATDIMARFHRMLGDNVCYTLGYDAFGLPAEQFAVQTGQHPRITTLDNIATMQRQLRRLGLSHDPRRSLATTDDDYVKWTQWIFLQIFNSYYDTDAIRPDGGTGAARPIAELIAAYESGAKPTPDGRPWAELNADERAAIVDPQRLAYVSHAPVNWCPGLGTVLANEEVTAEGRSERGNFPVFTKPLRQWMMRITSYADRLAEDLDLIDWPEKVRSMQRNWIGKSLGAHVDFAVHTPSGDAPLRVFTTRPDTLFGATFMVVSPEHPILAALPAAWPDGTDDAWKNADGGANGGIPAHLPATPGEAVAAYQATAAAKTTAERQAEGGKKTGVFTGLFATNPVNGADIPVFTADYVLMDYGTGAIMAVPGGDERDFEFATAYRLPIIYTVAPPSDHEGGAYIGDGEIINSANDEISLDGMDVEAAKSAIVDWLAARGQGEGTTTYRLRDWLFSRQRYWGEPFPIVFDAAGHPHALPDDALPVTLPDVPDYSPRTYDPNDADTEPEPPLGRNQDWVNVTLDLGDGPKQYRRDTNTMPNWAGSCWYYLRYLDPHDPDFACAPDVEKYWIGPTDAKPAGGADLYVGGVEHAVLHLLYSRFWHKVLYDLGYVSSREPFHKLFNQGYIQAPAYLDARGQYVPADEVEAHDDGTFTWAGEAVTQSFGKMGKSLKNMVTPDDMYRDYGADTFRLYEMSMGPLDLSKPWDTRAVVGSQRFLQRLWRNVVSEETGELTVVDSPASDETRTVLHKAIRDARGEMDAMRYNTAIAHLIVLNNHLTSLDEVPREAVEPLVLMVSPMAPHIAEELWARLGHDTSLAREEYPAPDPAYLVEETVTCVVQVQGKLRDKLEVPPTIDAAELERLALATDGAVRALAGRGVRTVIVRAPRLVNIVPE